MPLGIITLDLHGKNTYQAKIAIDTTLRNSRGVYRLHIIHGFHGGTILRDMIEDTYTSHLKVLRLQRVNDGATDLVLREL